MHARETAQRFLEHIICTTSRSVDRDIDMYTRAMLIVPVVDSAAASYYFKVVADAGN